MPEVPNNTQYAEQVNSLPRYRTGKEPIDDAIMALIADAKLTDDTDLTFEMIVSALRLGLEHVDRGDMKLVNNSLKELRYSFYVFDTYRSVLKCSIFGSARTKEDEPAYHSAKQLGEAMVDRNWMVMTGAGPGIMAAGLEGAGTENSFGINIVLPFEASANRFIADDPKLINFRYFFTRKLTFMKESSGFAALPGGFGTMDEAFELLTLMQTGKSPIVPLVLLDPEGSTYWERWRDFVEKELLAAQLISPADMNLFSITDDVETAANEMEHFYKTYHSSRVVGSRLVMRLKRRIDDDELAELTGQFADIIEDGEIERIEATSSETRDGDHPNLDRIAFQFNRHGFARLRVLINALNNATPTSE